MTCAVVDVHAKSGTDPPSVLDEEPDIGGRAAQMDQRTGQGEFGNDVSELQLPIEGGESQPKVGVGVSVSMEEVRECPPMVGGRECLPTIGGVGECHPTMRGGESGAWVEEQQPRTEVGSREKEGEEVEEKEHLTRTEGEMGQRNGAKKEEKKEEEEDRQVEVNTLSDTEGEVNWTRQRADNEVKEAMAGGREEEEQPGTEGSGIGNREARTLSQDTSMPGLPDVKTPRTSTGAGREVLTGDGRGEGRSIAEEAVVMERVPGDVQQAVKPEDVPSTNPLPAEGDEGTQPLGGRVKEVESKKNNRVQAEGEMEGVAGDERQAVDPEVGVPCSMPRPAEGDGGREASIHVGSEEGSNRLGVRYAEGEMDGGGLEKETEPVTVLDDEIETTEEAGSPPELDQSKPEEITASAEETVAGSDHHTHPTTTLN
ncbi:unnamed protein product [Boreogadus saida]